MSTLRAMLAVSCLLLVLAPSFADEYSGWKKDEKKQTYTCEYSYTPKDPKVTEKPKQTVVIYYGDKERSGWAYYYNADNKPWARCAVPGNPKYNEKSMHWESLKPDNQGYDAFKDNEGKAYPAGYCPAPKDGKSAIKDLPLPPK